MKTIISALLLSAALFGQQINLNRNVHGVLPAVNGGSGSQPGTSLPSTCVLGSMFFKTNATAGANIFGCTSTDTWTLEAGGSGSVTSVSFTGGLISIANPTSTPAFTVAGTSGGVPYFSSSSTWASSGALTADLPVVGGGAGAAPASGTRSGNTTKFASVAGSTASGQCLEWDADGNVVTAVSAAACGTVTSVATGRGLSGGPITASGTLLSTEVVNTQAGTTYTYLDSDGGKLVTHSNAGSIAATLPQANGSTFISGWYMDVQDRGAGTLTITPTTSTIDGAASLALTSGQGVRIVSDGTNYYTQRGSGGGGAGDITDIGDCTAGACFSSGGAGGTTITFRNATSGTISLTPVSGALGTRILSLPAATDTLIGKATTDTLTNKTFDTAGTGNSLLINGLAATANTGTGAVVRATAPTLGAITVTSVNKVAFTAPATGSTLTIPDGVTLTGPPSSATVATLGLTNTFTGRQNAGGAASTAPAKTGTTLPLTCTVGDLFFKTDATAGKMIYECGATDTWTQQLDGTPAYTAVNFSATPTFTASANTINSWAITLTGNVTGSTLASSVAGQVLNFRICQDGTGGRTFAWPSGFSLAADISPVASACTIQSFFWDGSAAQPTSSASASSGPDVVPETAAPSGSPTAGSVFEWADSSNHSFQVKDSSGNIYTMVRTGGDITFPNTVAKVNGIAITGTPAAGHVPTATSSSAATWQAPVKSCVVVIGDPDSSSAVLVDGNDSPVACPNDFGQDWTITTVACWADAGSPTVTPILTGGSGTSVLSGALTCGTASWAAGTVNGTPVVHSFSGAGATCSSTPCSIDANITTAGGTARYLVIKIVGTL